MSEFHRPPHIPENDAHPEHRALTEILEITPLDPPVIPESHLKVENDPQKPLAEICIGQTITDQHGDRYMVKKILGRGGVGVVYQVLQERNGLERALKVMHPPKDGARTQKIKEDVRRFRNEINMMASVHNPFILSPIDAIEIEIGGEKVLGVLTEVVEGNSLAHELDQTFKGMPCKRVAEYMGEISIALISLNEIGIIHRDIKPDNVFVRKTADGQSFATLADFGHAITVDHLKKQKQPPLSVFSADTGRSAESPLEGLKNESLKIDRLTHQGLTVGTISYMSPEQMYDYPLSQSSDLYSVGVMMYELISNAYPFLGENIGEVLFQKVNGTPRSFEELAIKDVPKWLEDIVMKLLRPNAQDRFASAKELFLALKEGVKKDYPQLLNKLPFSMNI